MPTFISKYTRDNPPPATKRFEGYVLGNLQPELNRGWIACRAFPDNVFFDLRRIKPFQREMLRIGIAADFTVEVNVPNSSDFRVNEIDLKQPRYPTNIDENTKGICIYYSSVGWCKHGDKCNYAHIAG